MSRGCECKLHTGHHLISVGRSILPRYSRWESCFFSQTGKPPRSLGVYCLGRAGLSNGCPMYGITDAIKLAVFTLQYACALMGVLIAIQFVIIGADVGIVSSASTSTAVEQQGTWGPGRSQHLAQGSLSPREQEAVQTR